MGLLATPLLLLTGFSLPFVVTANLLNSLATRIGVVFRLRPAIDRRRAALLVCGALPGLYAGARLLHAVDAHTFKLVAGIVTVVGAAATAGLDRRPPHGRPMRRTLLAAGFAGGVLATTTSLSGVPPALLLTRRRTAGISFMADLAVYFVATSALGLAALALAGTFGGHRLWPTLAYWLPGVLLGNWAGTSLGLRVPDRAFRQAAIVLALVAGVATIATAG
jgi:uncharacterized membrane protein YfcA